MNELADDYGVRQNIGQAGLNLAATLPIGRLSSTIVSASTNIGLSEIRQGIAKSLSVENDLIHIFQSKHNLNLLLPKAGSEANIIRRLYLSLGQSGKLPVHFSMSNSSTIESATHPPVIGYTQWWSNNISKPLDNLFSIGPMSQTTQTAEWTETIQWKGNK